MSDISSMSSSIRSSSISSASTFSSSSTDVAAGNSSSNIFPYALQNPIAPFILPAREPESPELVTSLPELMLKLESEAAASEPASKSIQQPESSPEAIMKTKTKDDPKLEASTEEGLKHVEAKTAKKKEKRRKSNKLGLSSYAQGKGLVLVFAMMRFNTDEWEERKGTNVDVLRIRRTFERKLGHDVSVHWDQTWENVKQSIDAAKKNLRYENYSSLTVFILTHGGSSHVETFDRRRSGSSWSDVEEEGPASPADQFGPLGPFGGQQAIQPNQSRLVGNLEYLVDVDGCKMSLMEDFVGQFSASKCPELEQKPKLFFIQECRGSERRSYKADNQRCSSPKTRFRTGELPDICDYLIVQSTLPKKVAFRHVQNGSPFIRTLCKSVERFRGHGLLDLLLLVNQRVAEKAIPDGQFTTRQVCEVTHTLRHLLYLDY